MPQIDAQPYCLARPQEQIDEAIITIKVHEPRVSLLNPNQERGARTGSKQLAVETIYGAGSLRSEERVLPGSGGHISEASRSASVACAFKKQLRI